jgi:hypothetical protein
LAVSAGPESCGVRSDGTLVCWGDVGNLVPPPGTFIGLSAGGVDFACAIRDDLTLACWGNTTR